MSSSPIKNATIGKVFVQHYNPVSGQQEWEMQDEDYDYSKEVASSAYADMLHDDERNQLYYDAIRKAVATLRARGDSVRVLDIGTGTGLLSMMALQCGADHITACESFEPMACCAEKVLVANGFAEKVQVIHKRSTELVLGEDLPERANLLVAELFDTELIGEGAISTYEHARLHLLTEDALLVPSGALVYAQVVSSDLLASTNVPYYNRPPHSSHLNLPSWLAECPGSISVHDLQLSQLDPSHFTAVSEPLCMFKFDWSGRDIPLSTTDTVHVSFLSRLDKSLECHAVFMWWHLIMDQDQDIVLSCAPTWAERDSSLAWRDHWMQAVYHLPRPFIPLTAHSSSKPLILTAARDDYSMWFSLSHGTTDVRPPAPHCSCGQHLVNPRTRLAQLSDIHRLNFLSRVLDAALALPRTMAWLVLGDASNVLLIGRLASHANVQHVYVHETIRQNRRLLLDFLELNALKEHVTLLPEDLSKISVAAVKHKIGVVFAEPHFNSSLLPWHNVRLSSLLSECSHLLPPSYASVQPHSSKSSPSDQRPQELSSSETNGRNVSEDVPSNLTNPTDFESNSFVSRSVDLNFPTSKSLESHCAGNTVPSLPISTSAMLLPACVSIHVMAVSFDDLWKIRAPCRQRCGFDLTAFDEMVDLARTGTGEVVEPQPLWEYPCYSLHEPVMITKLYLREPICGVQRHFKGNVELDVDALRASDAARPDRIKRQARDKSADAQPELYFNGVAVWADWHFADQTISTGPLAHDHLTGRKVAWNATCHQGVHLLRHPRSLLSPATSGISKIFHYCLDLKDGNFSFKFQLEEERCNASSE
ncbi:hypothetical protein HAZT_HAZT008656 [Hyalella azteca]|nr:hypothetical protein HAZT_HAZT008656 [Hyalella azteca]